MMIRASLRQLGLDVKCLLLGHRWVPENASTVAIWPTLATVDYCARCYDQRTRPPCPTCSGTIRETVGLVCQTCGQDYGRDPA